MLCSYFFALEPCQAGTFITSGSRVCQYNSLLITQLTPPQELYFLIIACLQFVPTDELYIWADRRYGDMEDTFGIAQAW